MSKRTGLLAAVVAAAVAVSTAVAAKEVKVGVVLTTSGGGAEFGQQILRGMKLYLKEHPNALGDNTVDLIVRDSKNPGGEFAKTAAQELITREGVDMLAGFVFSPNAMAVAPLITESKTPTIIMNAGTAWIPSMSPYFARVSFTMWHAGYNMGQYAAGAMGAKTAAVGYTDYPPGKDSLAAFKTGFEAAGGKVIDEIPMGGPRDVPDFTPFFQRVKDEKPDVFFVFVPAGNHATAVVKTYQDLGMRDAGIKLIGPGDIIQDTKLQGMGDAAVGVVTVFHYSADYKTPANEAFVKAWKKEYGTDSTPDFMAVGGWDGMAAIATVIKALDGNIDGDKAMKVLEGWTFDSPRGPITIDAKTRDIIQNEQVEKVVKGPDNKLQVEVIGQIQQVKDPCKELKVGKCAE
jgi:branched-chain amino acid transport system substrate-binding protein